MATRTKAKRAPRRAAKKKTQLVLAWQDDPASGLPPIERARPQLSQAPLKFRIKGAAAAPGEYQPGTPQFRYWTAAEALRRGGDFWGALGITRWELGSVLPVGLDEGIDLNAYYDRTELAFFHEQADGKIVYSGESPDVVCHEMGHACLDAHRPELWDAPFIEVGSFHESFGDMSAILSALQLPSVRQVALAGVTRNKPSDLSRLAEQLGWAIRLGHPTSVDRDCLRNACNAFHYVDPQTLPNSAPATQLSAEVHSFSRVFTGAFYELLGGMLKAQSGSPSEATLAATATDGARLLLAAIAAAPVQPNYYAQVASHMIDADTVLFGGKYRKALTTTFVKRELIPKSAVEPLLAAAGNGRGSVRATGRANGRKGLRPIAEHSLEPPTKAPAHEVVLSGAALGLPDRPILVHAPVEQKPLVAVSAAMLRRPEESPAELERATHRFVQMLVAHGRIETAPGAGARRLAGEAPETRHRTHVLEETAKGLRLVRRQFDCGS